jgi:hypothetical protein
MKIISCFVLGVFCVGYVQGKIIVTSPTWDEATRIYCIHIEQPRKIQVIELKPENVEVKTVTTIMLDLPENIAKIVDVNILHREKPVLLVLTTTGQLYGINLTTKNVDFILFMQDYFGVTNNFAGNIKIEYSQDEITHLIITSNAATSGIAYLELPASIVPDINFIREHLQVAYAPSLILNAKVLPKFVITERDKKIFIQGNTTTDTVIWELNLVVPTLSKLHSFGKHFFPIIGFMILDLQQRQNIDAIAVYGGKFLKFLSLDIFQNLKLPDNFISGENIQQIFIGPPVNEPFFSWYLVEKNTTGYFLRSNNFTDNIKLPSHTQVFLKHGELVLRSLEDNKLFVVCNKTGIIRELTVLNRGHTILNNIEETNQDFLFWDQQLKQHVLLNITLNTLYVLSFNLAFDKPKVLSWHRDG